MRDGGGGPALAGMTAERVGRGRPAFLRAVSPPWVNRCLGILDVLSALLAITPPPAGNGCVGGALLLSPPRSRTSGGVREHRPTQAFAGGLGGPLDGVAGFWRREPVRSCPGLLPPSLVPSSPPHLLSPIPSLSLPQPQPQPTPTTPSTQTLTLRERNSSWQLWWNSSL